MRLQLRSLVAAVALLFAASPFARAVDLLYVGIFNGGGDDGKVVTYDVSLGNATSIANSMNVFTKDIMTRPAGVAFDSSGNLFVASQGSNTVRKYDSSGNYQSSISAGISSPYQIAIGASDNLFVANRDSPSTLITRYDSSGNQLPSIGSGNTSGPMGLALDSAGNIYNGNWWSNKVTVFDQNGAFVKNITDQVSNGTSLTFNSTGYLYVSGYDSTISKYDPSGNYVSKITTGGMSDPYGLAFSSAGDLYVISSNNQKIIKYNANGVLQFAWSLPVNKYAYYGTFKTAAVPEPSTYALAAIATGVMATIARRRKARKA